MFAESGFESSDHDDEESNAEPQSGPHILSNGTNSSSRGNVTTVQFHRPGMPEYSVVAGARYDTAAHFDPRLFNGDSWLSDDCHCLRCEGLRALEKMRALPTPPVLVLLDLDNFGYRQFQLCPPRLGKAARITNDGILSSILLWGFFGSCFTRYYNVWPTDTLLANVDSSLNKDDIDGSQNRKESIWFSLSSQSRLLLTPCSGSNQGADCVMRDVVHAFANQDMIVMTGDGELVRLLQEERRLLRKRKSSEEDDDDGAAKLLFVDMSRVEKRLVPVWHALASQLCILGRCE